MKCKHNNTRKLFWSNSNPNKWERTNVSICLDCEAIVGIQEIKLKKKDTKPKLNEKTAKVFAEQKTNKFGTRKE